VNRRNYLSLLFIGILTALSGFSIFKFGLPKMSGRVQALYPRHSETLSNLNLTDKIFGDNLVDVILLPVEDPLSNDSREVLVELEEKLQELIELRSIISPLRAFQSMKLPVRLVSEDKRWVRFLLEIPANLPDAARITLHQEIERIRPENSIRSGSFYAGEVATSSLEAETRVRAPACLITIFILLLLWTRNPILAGKILLPTILTGVIVAGALSLFEFPLGAIAQLVPPLLLAVSTSYSSYIASRIIDSSDQVAPLAGAGKSLTLATTTTIIGFISLFWMDCQGVDDFAQVMTGGTVISSILTWVIIPRIISVPAKTIHSAARINIGRLSLFNSKLVIAISLVLLVLSTGLWWLRVDTVPLDFFPDGSLEKNSIVRAEKVFPGSHFLSLGMKFAAPLDSKHLEEITRLEDKIRKIPGVHHTFAAPAFFELSRDIKKRELDDATLTKEFGPPSISSSNGLYSRVMIETDYEGRLLMELAEKVREVMNERGAFISNTFLASRELVISETSNSLSRGLIESVLSALLIVWILTLSLLRNLKMSLVGLIPTILPVVGVFGALGLFFDSLNLGAAIVAACALGMISDFSFHLLFLWREFGPNGLDKAVKAALLPFLLTGITLVIGFSPTMFSPIGPVRSFGFLLGGSVALGIFLNLRLLPMLLKKLR